MPLHKVFTACLKRMSAFPQFELAMFVMSALLFDSRSTEDLLKHANPFVFLRYRENPAAPTLFESVAHRLGLGSSTLLVGVFFRVFPTGKLWHYVYIVKGEHVLLIDNSVSGCAFNIMTFHEFKKQTDTYTQDKTIRDVGRAQVSQARVLSAVSVE